MIYYDDGSRKTTSYARFLMEQHLGRNLTADEEVDHIDDDQMNDDLTNLQVLTPLANQQKRAAQAWVTFTCPICFNPARRTASRIRHNRKQGKAGPFCGKSCARRYQLQQV